ncbi:8-oxo-dGTP diphosphatase MutT [Fictibacillus nanhaiensis]|uniref:8-oxo-dGTP diphosphatase MutT n=1 Tax=Fictibacillus nanhaiensis TaxID=742169 RepID=UPI0020425512|nr:8-oxo-dGTP diphosphatase MutT [Fictibacillus nanhaiensis]MCM3730105.1 8-oxo-dGTP diphosphatase MutT [Fictibacillus nanhaiensis]
MKKVTAVLLKHNGKLLIAKRDEQRELGNLWEFPGGKIEQGETPEECLTREIKEEFQITIKVEEYYDESIYEYEFGSIHLLVYWASWIDGKISATEHEDYKWVTVGELHNFNFAPADIPIVERLRREENEFSA